MKTRILSVLSIAAALVFATGCTNPTDTQTAADFASGAVSLVLANNPQHEPDVAAAISALSALNTAPTLGSIAGLLTTARVNPLITNAFAPAVVDIYNRWVKENPTGTVAQFNSFLAQSLNGGLQLYLAEHPQVQPTVTPAPSS